MVIAPSAIDLESSKSWVRSTSETVPRPSQRGHMPPFTLKLRRSVLPAPRSIVIAPPPRTEGTLKENALEEPMCGCPRRLKRMRSIALASVAVPTVERGSAPIRCWSTMIAVVRPSSTSTSGRDSIGMKPCTKVLYVSLISRCDSAAMVPNTSELLPEPETPVNTVSRRFGISTLMSLRLFTRAPWTRIRSWGSELTSLEAARGLCRPGWSGRRLTGDLPLLEDPDRVAEGVADAQVGAVEVIGGLLGEVGDAPRLEGLVQTPDVVRLEHEPAQRALRDQLAELRGGGFVMHRRARLLEGDLGDVARDAHRQPAVGTLLDILALLQPELVDVEVKSLVLVEDHDGGDVEFGDHRSFSPLRDLMGMTLMLGGRRCGGVSKTARSHRHPRRHHGPHGPQLEAVGRHHRPMPHAVLRRRLADDLSKRAAEGPPAGEADVEADVGDAAVGLTQEEHRPLHPPPLQVTVRRLPEDGAEAADEVSLGDMGHRGHGADVKRFGVSAVHGIAGAQQPPVELFDFPAHGSTLRDQGAWLTTSSSAGSRRLRRRPSAGAVTIRHRRTASTARRQIRRGERKGPGRPHGR